jgi:hypothetical protein
VVYSLFSIPPKNLGDPGSSRGTLERIRVGLTRLTTISERVRVHEGNGGLVAFTTLNEQGDTLDQ